MSLLCVMVLPPTAHKSYSPSAFPSHSLTLAAKGRSNLIELHAGSYVRCGGTRTRNLPIATTIRQPQIVYTFQQGPLLKSSYLVGRVRVELTKPFRATGLQPTAFAITHAYPYPLRITPVDSDYSLQGRAFTDVI